MRTPILAAVAAIAAFAAANLITATYGPEWSVVTALLLIGFDFVARDLLHDRLRGTRRIVAIGALAVAGALVAWAVNPDAEQIAKASAAAWVAAILMDTIVYHRLRRLPWVERSGLSKRPPPPLTRRDPHGHDRLPPPPPPPVGGAVRPEQRGRRRR